MRPRGRAPSGVWPGPQGGRRGAGVGACRLLPAEPGGSVPPFVAPHRSHDSPPDDSTRGPSPLPDRSPRSGRRRVPGRGSETRPRRRQADRLPADRRLRVLDELRRPPRQRQSRRHRHRERPVAHARRRGGGGPGAVAHDLGACRLHALPLRAQRHDVPLHPPQQRPDREVRGSRRLQARHVVRGRGRREGDGGRADRLERRLRRRGGEPPPPLRGASRGRRRREPVPVPQRRRAPPLPRPPRRDVLARDPRRAGRRRRRHARAPRDRGPLVARRAVDVGGRRAPRDGRDRRGRRRRHLARGRAREPVAACPPGAHRTGGDGVHREGEGHGGGAAGRARRPRRGARDPAGRHDHRGRRVRSGPGVAGHRHGRRGRARPAASVTGTRRSGV